MSNYKIALAGPAGVGKSTTAKYLAKRLYSLSISKNNKTLSCVNYAFADPLYELVSHITEIPINKLKDQSYKNNIWDATSAPLPSLVGMSPRKFLQLLGTEAIRNNISQSFWVEKAFKNTEKYDVVIFEDARFSNEFKDCDLVIELEREGIQYAMDHPSAMPPDEKYVWKKVKLYPEYNFDELCYNILDKLELT